MQNAKIQDLTPIIQKVFLSEVNDFNLEIRYPDYKKAFYIHCTKEYATEKFNKIKDTYQWLKSRIASRK